MRSSIASCYSNPRSRTPSIAESPASRLPKLCGAMAGDLKSNGLDRSPVPWRRELRGRGVFAWLYNAVNARYSAGSLAECDPHTNAVLHVTC